MGTLDTVAAETPWGTHRHKAQWGHIPLQAALPCRGNHLSWLRDSDPEPSY